jgi:GAF domain-containing protein
MSLSPGLQLFYDLVHSLNSTLDLDRVLAQVIDRVNAFLDIDATSVSLIDPESQELVIRMTIGQSKDPRPGLRLPPFAGIGGWVVRHGEAVLIPDAQQDDRFYPAVDQLTGFTTRSVLCVPLRLQERTIGVIQAINGTPNVFSFADLSFMVTLADVAALAIENARLFTSEQRLRHEAEKVRLISEVINTSLRQESALELAMQYLYEIVPCDSAAVFVRQNVPVFKQSGASDGGLCLHNEPYLKGVTAWGFEDRSAVLALCRPVSDLPLFERMRVYKRPIAIADIQDDDRYVQLRGAEPVRSWLGVPMIADGEVIGQVTLNRHRVDEFTQHDIDVALVFAQQASIAVTNAQLYRDARDRADELAILNEIAMAVTASLEIDVLLARAVDALLALLGLGGAGIALLNESGDGLTVQVHRSLSAGLVEALQCESIADDSICYGVVVLGHTMLVPSRAEGIEPGVHACAFVPLCAADTVLGLLAVQSADLDRPSARQLTLLEAIGRQIGIAVDRAHLCQGMQKPKEV